MKSEFVRKSIHVLSSVIPLYYLFTDDWTVMWLLAPATVLFVGGDLLRLYVPFFKRLFLRIFSRHIRPHELTHLIASTYMLIAMHVVIVGVGILCRQKEIAVLAVMFLCVGDAAAAVCGKLIGGVKIAGEKTLAGTAAFVAVSAALLPLTPSVGFMVGMFGVLVAAALELYSGPFNDNFSIPVGAAGAMWLLQAGFMQN